MSDSVSPCIIACQPPLSMGFPRQEYWSEFPFPSPGDLPHPGIKPESPAGQVDSLSLSHLGSPYYYYINIHVREGNGTPSSTIAWKIPWMEEPGRLQSMGSLRVRHNRATSLSLFTFMHWRRKWQPTPVFLPGESQGRGSLVDCRLWGCTELDMTDAT